LDAGRKRRASARSQEWQSPKQYHPPAGFSQRRRKSQKEKKKPAMGTTNLPSSTFETQRGECALA
jgi:hypothetical protein